MDVVGHQPIGQEGDYIPPNRAGQLLKVSIIILGATEDHLVIVSVDRHVVNGTVMRIPSRAWHAKCLTPLKSCAVLGAGLQGVLPVTSRLPRGLAPLMTA